jgi:hypothetical protein
MNLFRRNRKLEPTGKVIDMTKTFWGHNISMSTGPDDKGLWRAAIWNSNGARVGDELTYMTNAGVVRSIITNVESAPGVWDMYFVDGRITHLNDRKVN